MTTHDTPTSPTVNVPLLRKAVEFAEASHSRLPRDKYGTPSYPHEGVHWKQNRWSTLTRVAVPEDQAAEIEQLTPESCGTAYCIAGYVTQLQPGYEARVEGTDPYNGHVFLRLAESLNGEPIAEGDQQAIARDALGITHDQAVALFYAYNTIEHVRELAEEFAGEKL